MQLVETNVNLKMDDFLYHYKAKVIRVIDGDTAEVEIDVGFRWKTIQRLRLLGINAPEKKGETLEKGKEAQKRLTELIGGKEVYIATREADAFDRWLAWIYLDDGTCVNKVMLDEGYAVQFLK